MFIVPSLRTSKCFGKIKIGYSFFTEIPDLKNMAYLTIKI